MIRVIGWNDDITTAGNLVIDIFRPAHLPIIANFFLPLPKTVAKYGWK
jgi:hypothetical protein